VRESALLDLKAIDDNESIPKFEAARCKDILLSLNQWQSDVEDGRSSGASPEAAVE
jgi:hypothetical protein